MKKHLFLTGTDSQALSKLLAEALGPAFAMAGGFVTVRDNTRGLQVFLLPAAAAGGVEGFTPSLFLDFTGEQPTKDNELIRNEAVRLLEEAQYYPFAVLDCFGGIDLMIPQYRAALQELLNTGLPIIGVLVSPAENRKLKAAFSISDRFDILSANLPAVLSADDNTVLLDAGKLGEAAVLRLCRQWANEYIYG